MKLEERLEDYPREHPDEHDKGYNWVSDFVYGGIDGVVTTFAVVAGVEGASLSIPIILILGFANLFADGFSMASGKFLSDRADIQQYEKIRQMEHDHLNIYEEHERQEIRDMLAETGFEGDDIERATEIITSDPDRWVDYMMRNEFHMTLENINPIKGALSTFIAFVLVGFIPLIGYTFNGLFGLGRESIFAVTVASTLVALFFVGAVKSRFTMQHFVWAGLETALIGGVAAGVSYGVGYVLSGLVGA